MKVHVFVIFLFGFVILSCTKGTDSQNTSGRMDQAILVNENNIPEAYKAIGAYVDGLRSLANDQKTRLTPTQIRDKINSLPQTLGIGSKEAFQQPTEFLETTTVDTATAEKYLSSSTRGIRGIIDLPPANSVEVAPVGTGQIIGSVSQYLIDIIAYLTNLPNQLAELPPSPETPAPQLGQPADLLVGGRIPPPQGFGIGQPPPDNPPPAAPNNPPLGGGFVGPPSPHVPCLQFRIVGKCCNPDFGGRGALADQCTVYYRIPINLPPRFVGFFYGNCSWFRGTGLVNCPAPGYFTGWSCPPRDPNSC